MNARLAIKATAKLMANCTYNGVTQSMRYALYGHNDILIKSNREKENVMRALRQKFLWPVMTVASICTMIAGLPCAQAVTPRLSSVENFRDVAGSGYHTSDGSHMRTDVLFRSNMLRPSKIDENKLVQFVHIAHVYDLRTAAESAKKPDILPPVVAYTQVNVNEDIYNTAGTAIIPTPSLTTEAAAEQYLEDLNRSFVTVPEKRHAFGRLLTLIATHQGAQVLHCAAGKDRTGWASAIIQLLLGVSQNDVMHDYMLTNQYSAHDIAVETTDIIEHQGTGIGRAMSYLLTAHPQALKAGLDCMYAQYGTVYRYATRGLGLTSTIIAALRTKYVATQ